MNKSTQTTEALESIASAYQCLIDAAASLYDVPYELTDAIAAVSKVQVELSHEHKTLVEQQRRNAAVIAEKATKALENADPA